MDGVVLAGYVVGHNARLIALLVVGVAEHRLINSGNDGAGAAGVVDPRINGAWIVADIVSERLILRQHVGFHAAVRLGVFRLTGRLSGRLFGLGAAAGGAEAFLAAAFAAGGHAKQHEHRKKNRKNPGQGIFHLCSSLFLVFIFDSRHIPRDQF